jgi:hypothetical protein
MPRKSNKSKPVNREVTALWPIMQLVAGLPDIETARNQISASMRRMVDTRRQMERRAGPLFEVARYRSDVISDAYRAAGSPPKPRGPFLGVGVTGKKLYGPPDQNTPEYEAWRAWVRQKVRLQRQLGTQRWKPRQMSPQ